MAIKKIYPKTKPGCKVTFSLPKEAVKDAKCVYLVGEFNDWHIHATPMKKSKDGSFKIELELKKGKSYQYRFLIDDHTWENDWKADRYVPSPYGACENSVVEV
ncbi:MAG TPA: isoamylase early set domain-containing protein [bacterium]